MSKFAADMVSHPIFNNDETIPINILGYTIGQVAKMLHLSISQLRYYDNQGLLPFLKRNEKGGRVFDDESLNFLK